MDYPKISPSEFVVIIAEGETGIILTSSGTRAVTGIDNFFNVFPDRESALNFIREKQAEHDTWEFTLRNHKDEVLEYFTATRWS